jgi:hypothetical protein
LRLRTSSQTRKLCLRNNLVIGVVKEYHHAKKILLDYDSANLGRLPGRILSVMRILGLHVQWIRYDKTQHGWHIVLDIGRSLQPAETIALQAIAGSSWEREAMNLRRVLQRPDKFWLRRFNILYERKLQVGERESSDSARGARDHRYENP